MISVIDWVLKHCGSSLEKVTTSKRFTFLRRAEGKNKNLKKGSDRDLAFRAGHLRMGSWLNNMSENEALKRARQFVGENPCFPSLDERILIRLCGEELISSATNCLPDSVLELAKQWQNSTVEKQIDIVRQLFFEFRSNGQNTRGTLSVDLIREKIESSHYRQEEERRGYLPGLYGKWDQNTSPAHCQGKSQMLLAFAKFAGIEAMIVHPVIHVKDKMRKIIREFRQIVVKDLTERGLKDSCEMLADSLSASFLDDRLRDKDAECFHVGVIFKLKDGRWIMIDPHGLSWGLIPESWNLEKTCKTLRKYRSVLPGLTITAGDEQSGDEIIKGKIKLGLDLIRRSREMGQQVQEKVENVMDFVDILNRSDDFDLLLKLESEESGKELSVDLSNPEIRRYAVMMMVFGGMEEMMSMKALFDPNFLKKRIDSWLSFYHCCAMNLFLEKETNEGKLIHPICDIAADPVWSVAIAAMNAASIDLRKNVSEEESYHFFVRNSFDQTTLYNAVFSRDPLLGRAAQKTLLSMRYLHPMCARRLERLDGIGGMHV